MKGRMYDSMILEIVNSLKNKNIFPSINVSSLMSVYPHIKSAQPMIHISRSNGNKKIDFVRDKQFEFFKTKSHIYQYNFKYFFGT